MLATDRETPDTRATHWTTPTTRAISQTNRLLGAVLPPPALGHHHHATPDGLCHGRHRETAQRSGDDVPGEEADDADRYRSDDDRLRLPPRGTTASVGGEQPADETDHQADDVPPEVGHHGEDPTHLDDRGARRDAGIVHRPGHQLLRHREVAGTEHREELGQPSTTPRTIACHQPPRLLLRRPDRRARPAPVRRPQRYWAAARTLRANPAVRGAARPIPAPFPVPQGRPADMVPVTQLRPIRRCGSPSPTRLAR